MNRALLFFILSSLFLGCSKNSYEKISYLETYVEKGSKQLRVPASIDKNSCFIDEFNIERIKRDILQLEKHFTNKVEIPEKYRYLKLNTAETHYIKKFHNYIYFDSETSSCRSLPCILNRAYGKVDGEEGYRIYHWFLVMGSGISTLDELSTKNSDGEKKIEGKFSQDYLFPLRELKLFNMLSRILPIGYRNITNLTFHRYPDGTQPREDVAGLFWGSYINSEMLGKIDLTEQELVFSNEKKLIDGYYVDVLIHEMTHALDYSLGERDWKSKKKEWTKFSWKRVEAKTMEKDVDGNDMEKIDVSWVVDEDKATKEGFLRDYQKTNYKEDFAEVGAYYFTDSKELKSTSPGKFKYFQDDFYHGKTFLKDDELSYIDEALVKDFKDVFWSILTECTVDTSDSLKGGHLQFPDSVRFLPAEQKNCLTNKVEAHFAQKLKEHRMSRYRACAESDGVEDEIVQRAIDFNSDIMNNSINEIIIQLLEVQDII